MQSKHLENPPEIRRWENHVTHTRLQEIIKGIPERTGATVILVDHDMVLVQACCSWAAVLDFGRLIASGPTSEVLRDERVMQAYLGVDDSIGDLAS